MFANFAKTRVTNPHNYPVYVAVVAGWPDLADIALDTDIDNVMNAESTQFMKTMERARIAELKRQQIANPNKILSEIAYPLPLEYEVPRLYRIQKRALYQQKEAPREKEKEKQLERVLQRYGGSISPKPAHKFPRAGTLLSKSLRSGPTRRAPRRRANR